MTIKHITMIPVDSTITIAPQDRRNICTLLNTSGTFDFVVETTNCQFGDEIVLIFSKASENLTLNFPSEQFVLTYCSSPVQVLQLVGEGNNTENPGDVSSDTWQTQFFFDGTKFIYTMDIG